LSGQLPNLSTFSKLEIVDLEENQFTGSVLMMMMVSTPNNAMTMTTSTTNLTMLTSLKEFRVAKNDLTGNLDDSMFAHSTLEVLSLNHNRFTGHLPMSFGNSPSLRTLYLQSNRLTGTIPPIGPSQLSNLVELRVEDNLLSGAMPPSICSLRTTIVEDDNIHDSDSSLSLPLLETLTADCGNYDNRNDALSPNLFCHCCSSCY
jgi:Leucine-rich repeat (LRR) protein